MRDQHDCYPQLDEYYSRSYISQVQYDAGKMFARDWRVGHKGLRHYSMQPRTRGPEAGFDMSDAARERGRKAARAIGELRHVVIAVCCLGKTAREWATEDNRRPEEGMAILKFGLDALARFYAITAMS